MIQPAVGGSLQNSTASRADSLYWDAAAVALLAALAVWLFRGHFFGDSLWIGNPDRLNSDLKILKHYLSASPGGTIPAWDENEMMGYDSLVLPYTFPNPIVYVVAMFGGGAMYVAMGYVVMSMLSAAGIAAYAFLRASMPPGMPVVVGAICYEFSSLTLLKASQNSMSFAVFIVIPLLLLAIRHVRRENSAWCFLALAVLVGGMLNLMFLQKAAYALMLAGAYAASRAWSLRSWRPLVIFALATGVAVAFAFPRMLGIGLALAEYKRVIAGIDLRDFDSLYSFQNIYPYEILRWFDSAIFGRSPSDSVAIGNNINLTEGFLLSTSGIVPFLLASGLARRRFAWLNPVRNPGREEGFFFWMLVFGICVIVLKPATHLMFLLFMKMDFTHARFQIAALLPLALLVAAALGDLAPEPPEDGKGRWRVAAGIAAGLLTALIIDAISGRIDRTVSYYDIFNSLNKASSPRVEALLRTLSAWYTDLYNGRPQAPIVRLESLARIVLSCAAFFALRRLTLKSGTRARRASYAAICALVGGQCLLAANQQVNGPQASEFSQPFYRGDFYQAQRGEFTPPTAEQLGVLHRRIEPDKFRVALICDPRIADGFCAGHVPEFWRLRAIDGYYGLAVPRRLRALPWPSSISLRTISFSDREPVPWELLGFLNVRSVLVGNDGVFRNIKREGEQVTGLPDPAEFEIRLSPSRVTPRAFFAAAATPVASPEEAARLLFRPEGIVDPVGESFVEGLVAPRKFPQGGPVGVNGRDDSLELHFDASQQERLLVLNELYFPGWRAEADGKELPVLAANAVMRSVVVPAGATRVRFDYRSYVNTAPAMAFRICAALALLGLFFVLRRVGKAG